MIRIVSMLAAAAATAALAAPAAAAPAWEGVWQGTIGALPVRACLVQRDWGAFGAYYYVSHLKLIPLNGAKNGSPFREGAMEEDPKAARWTIAAAGAGALSGQWAQGDRTLPIRLTRMEGVATDEFPCTSMTFHRPRLSGIGTVSQRATKDGISYTRLILDPRGRFGDVKVETFQLDGSSAPVRAINASLHAPFAGDPPEWFDCLRSALEQNSLEGDIDDVTVPRLITARWLVATRQSDSYCGGAHPDEASEPLLFDLSTGRPVDLHDWLNAKAIKRERFGSGADEAKELTPEFRSVLLARWKPADTECGDPVREADFWTIELTRTGLVFRPELAHVVQACADDVALPFARLRPYLSAEGLKQVAALQAEPSRTR
jgi:hypothetical protein